MPIKGGGRDPLALSRASDWLVGILLPSIITTTNRARYYSFYPWALRTAREVVAGDAPDKARATAFRDAFGRMETAFSISSLMREGRSRLTVVGSRTLLSRWDEFAQLEDVDLTGIKVLSGDYGGFGQYYEGCLKTLGAGGWKAGVWEMEEDSLGHALASVFSQSAASSPYISGGHAGSTSVPLQVLENSAATYCLDGIRDSGAQAERDLLLRMFLEQDGEGEVAASATTTHSFRRDTIGLLLHVMATYEQSGHLVAEWDIVRKCLFWPHYYGFHRNGGEWSAYAPPPALQVVAGHWRMFCLHQFFTSSTEEVLQEILDTLETRRKSGMTLDELADAMWDGGAFVQELEAATGTTLAGPAHLLDYFRSHGTLEDARLHFGPHHSLAEWWLCPVSREEIWQDDETGEETEEDEEYEEEDQEEYEEDPEADEEYEEDEPDYDGQPDGPDLQRRLARAFAIWAQIHAKWAGSEDPAYLHLYHGAAGDGGSGWSVGTCIQWMDDWDARRPSWHDAIRETIVRIYEKHRKVAKERNRQNTGWFNLEGSRYYHLQGVNASFRADRHRNLVAILQDLLLITDGREEEGLLRLTASGRSILSSLTATHAP